MTVPRDIPVSSSLRFRHLSWVIVASLFWQATATQADDSSASGREDASKTATTSAPMTGAPVAPVTASSTNVEPANKEVTALAFAAEHHPELISLMESLQATNPEGYRKAIHDLHKTQERIVRVTEKNPVRAAHELSMWKVDSRIRLTAARSAMGATDELRSELRSLVEQRRNLKLDWLKLDRKQAAERLAKLDADLQKSQAKEAESLSAEIDAEVDKLLNSVKKKQPRVAAAQRDAKKSKPEKSKRDPDKKDPSTTVPKSTEPAVVAPAAPSESTPSSVPSPSPEQEPKPDLGTAAPTPAPSTVPVPPSLTPQ